MEKLVWVRDGIKFGAAAPAVSYSVCNSEDNRARVCLKVNEVNSHSITLATVPVKI